MSGKQVMSAFYINELLQRFITFHDPHPELYVIYKKTLESFSHDNEELALRRFEKHLLAEIGYGLNLEYDSDNGAALIQNESYYYDLEKGPVNIKNNEINNEFIISGQTLLDMSREEFSNPQSQKEAKQLMRIILSHHLGDKPLKTRSLHWYKPL